MVVAFGFLVLAYISRLYCSLVRGEREPWVTSGRPHSARAFDSGALATHSAPSRRVSAALAGLTARTCSARSRRGSVTTSVTTSVTKAPFRTRRPRKSHRAASRRAHPPQQVSRRLRGDRKLHGQARDLRLRSASHSEHAYLRLGLIRRVLLWTGSQHGSQISLSCSRSAS